MTRPLVGEYLCPGGHEPLWLTRWELLTGALHLWLVPPTTVLLTHNSEQLFVQFLYTDDTSLLHP